MEQVKKRDSNLELFRIITMLLIIAHHYVVNSGLGVPGGVIYSNPLSLHSIVLLIAGAWGKVGINCFVMITGYFMCKSNITLKKFLKLLFEIMFYRLIIYSAFWISGKESVSLRGLVSMLIPIKTISTGFTSAFLVFYFFIPFLNILIKNMTEKQHLLLLGLCGFTYVFLGTVPKFSVNMNYVSWFMVVYLIASYIRLYPKILLKNNSFCGGMLALSVLMSIASVIFCTWTNEKYGLFWSYQFVADSNNFLAIITAMFAFTFFKNLNIKYNKIINLFAASTFGVLCIHAGSNSMINWLWKDLLDNVGANETSFGYLHMILSVLGVFIVCSCIDIIRIYALEKPFFKWYDKRFSSAGKH